MSRNRANSINDKKIVMSEGLICCSNVALLNNKPNIIALNIKIGSSFSNKSIPLFPCYCINYNYDKTPGRSDYKKGSMFGQIFDSRFRSTNGITMRPKLKIQDSRDCYPGPGAYKAFSEFSMFEQVEDNDNKTNKASKNEEKQAEEEYKF